MTRPVRGSVDLKLIQSVLLELGLDVDSLQPLAADESILTLIVPGGAVAVDAWQRLRAALDGTGRWPVICGNAEEELDQLDERLGDFDSPAAVLADVPTGDPLAALRKAEHRARQAMLDWFKSQGGPVPAFMTEEDVASDADDGEGEGKAEVEWPEDPPSREVRFASTVDHEDEPLDECLVALLPTAEPADAPAYLRFGGFNACPAPDIHVAMLRDWGRRFGAAPACVTHDVIECLVTRPPQTPDEARALAREQFIYCGDIVTQGVRTVERLALELWRAPTWFFWWD